MIDDTLGLIYIIFVVPNQDNPIFLKNSKGKLVKILIFLIKVIYNILFIIKNYIKSENFLLVLNKLSQTRNFLPYNQNHYPNISKKLIKLNKTTIQNKIKDCNSFSI